MNHRHPLVVVVVGSLLILLDGLWATGCAPPPPPSVAQDLPLPRPNFGTTVSQEEAPPPLSGGTLLVLPEGRMAVAADPDRDRVSLVDLAGGTAREVRLTAGDEPGRLAVDAANRVHVALRRGGQLVTLDPVSGAVLDRRPVCPAPRGLAYDAEADVLHIACASGELVTLPAAGGPAVRTMHLEPDLRDVLVSGSHLLVSRFRSAELLTIARATGTLIDRGGDRDVYVSQRVRGGIPFVPEVAWRLVPGPEGTALMLHQRAQAFRVVVDRGGYGGEGLDLCGGGVVHSALTLFGPVSLKRTTPHLPLATLAIDVALSPEQKNFAVATPGNAYNGNAMPTLYFGSFIDFAESRECENSALRALSTEGRQPVAVAFLNETDFVVQMREPAELWVLRDFGQHSQRIPLGGESRSDTGHDVFHSNSGAGVACASCHAEGTDDGRVWDFSTGPRRTQVLHRGLLATAPFHWSGDLPDLPHLIDEVLVGRMSGPRLDPGQEAALGRWLDHLPPDASRPGADPQAVERGRLLFQSASVGCATCHNGPAFTNNATVDVGTRGGPFQVPSLLGVGARAPYLHDGCARTLRERFAPGCDGSGRHGHTSQLSEAEIGDLIAYLETL